MKVIEIRPREIGFVLWGHCQKLLDDPRTFISPNTRGIWKVLSMVFYLSNRFTNPIMFGIILKSYLFSMLPHKFYEDIIMRTRTISL